MLDSTYVPFPRFQRKLIPLYVNYLKEVSKQTIVLIFEYDGKIFRKFKQGSVPFLCGLKDEMALHLPRLSEPITACVNHTIQGFHILSFQTSKKFFEKIESSYTVSVSYFQDFSQIQSFYKQSVENAIMDISEHLGANATSSRYISSEVCSLYNYILVNIILFYYDRTICH